MSDVASPSTGTAGWVTDDACSVVLCIVDLFQMPFSRWGPFWRIFRCSSALVWGGCTDTGYFWSPGISKNSFGHRVCRRTFFCRFPLSEPLTYNLAGCTLLNGCSVEWNYAQFTKCCSPKKMASSILTETSLSASISRL